MAKNENPGCFGFLFGGGRNETGSKSSRRFSKERDDHISYPYKTNRRFLTPAEHSFFLVTQMVLGEQYMVCPQVSLSALFWINDPSSFGAAFNRIARKRVDFVICDALTMKILFGVELDDSSHKRAARMERDEFVNNVFQAADLPLIHVRVKESYSTAELKNLFDRTLGREEVVVGPFLPEVGVKPVEIPAIRRYEICPNCGSPFKMRESIAGPNKGRMFYVCSRYPDCKTKFLVD